MSMSRNHADELIAFLELWGSEWRSPPLRDWQEAVGDAGAVIAELVAARKQLKEYEEQKGRVEQRGDQRSPFPPRIPNGPGFPANCAGHHSFPLRFGQKVPDLDTSCLRCGVAYGKAAGKCPHHPPTGREATLVPEPCERCSDFQEMHRCPPKCPYLKVPEQRTCDIAGHSFPLRGDQTEPDEVANCLWCGTSYAGTGPVMDAPCSGKRSLRPATELLQNYSVRVAPVDRGGGMPMDRVEVTFPQGQNTVTAEEAKRAARETLTKMEEERKPVSAETFEQKAARVEQAVAELKAYRETLDKKLAEVMSLAEELRKEREEQ